MPGRLMKSKGIWGNNVYVGPRIIQKEGTTRKILIVPILNKYKVRKRYVVSVLI